MNDDTLFWRFMRSTIFPVVGKITGHEYSYCDAVFHKCKTCLWYPLCKDRWINKGCKDVKEDI